MGSDQAVALARHALEACMMVSAPILIIATVVGVMIGILQTVTSVQDMTLSTVPRLAIMGTTVFLLAPWLMRALTDYTIRLFSNLHPYVH